MKKASINISYEEEKLTALRWYLGQKDIQVEDELTKAVELLFQKNVPASVRSYITRQPEEEAPKSQRKNTPPREVTVDG